MVPGLNVIWVDGQLAFKFPRRFIKLPQIYIDQAGVEMRKTGFAVHSQSRIQLFERLGRLALVVVNLSEQDMKLRTAAVQGRYPLNDLIRLIPFLLLDESDREHVVKTGVIRFDRDDLG